MIVCWFRAARTQPIIVNATADMMKEHFLPVARKLREQSLNMRKEEEEFHAETRRLQHRKESGEVESEIQEVRNALCRSHDPIQLAISKTLYQHLCIYLRYTARYTL